MAEPRNWQGTAHNQAVESENRIHSDDVARQYGFRGGLVPGVTVYAYLVHPAIEAWGMDWLNGGTASVVLRKPLYDGAKFDVIVTPDGPEAYRAKVVDEAGVHCADGRVGAPASSPPVPSLRGDAKAPPVDKIPNASRSALEALRERGLGAVHFEWPGKTDYDRYTQSLDDMPDLVRPDRGGYANPGFTLGLANWVLSRNVKLGPWIHVQSDVSNLAAIPAGSQLVVEARVTDLFQRSGHEFVDLEVSAFIEPDTPVLTASHRAIYQLRPA
jgi:hypothetical protein